MPNYLSDFPELVKEFDSTNNGKTRPEDLTHGSDRKVWWKCSKDNSHKWEAAVNKRVAGRGCPFCSGHKTTPQERTKKLQAAGWLMKDQYKSNTTKAQFECLSCRKVINSTYSQISSKHQQCACKRFEYLHEKWSAEAKNRGGKLLTPYYIGGRKTKYLWMCSQGHEWTSTPQSVIEAGSWCNECRGVRKREFEELKDVVSKRKGILLTKEFLGSEASYEFECNLGHQFSNRFRNVIDRGQWCPTCNRGTKSEELARTAMEQIFDAPFPKVRPDWLKNTRGRQMELDGYNEGLGIAFEYQGVQHYDANKFFYGKDLSEKERRKILEIRILDDNTKMTLCKKNDVNLFILSHTDEPETFSQVIKEQAEKFGLDDVNTNFNDDIDFTNAYIRDDRMSELRELLKKKKITVLSDKWIAVDTKYLLKCEVCDNQWSARGNAFFNSRSVAGCDRCARKKNTEKQRLGIKALVEFAEKFGGTVLSKTYVRRKHNYEFKCSNGHIFTKNFNNMLHRNEFCTVCKTIDRK